jgi:hypothetical protein
MKRRPPPKKTVPAPTDENLTYTITQTASDVQSRRIPFLMNSPLSSPLCKARVVVSAIDSLIHAVRQHVLFLSRHRGDAGNNVALENRVYRDQGMGCHLACALQHEREQSVGAKPSRSPSYWRESLCFLGYLARRNGKRSRGPNRAAQPTRLNVHI